MMPIFELFKLSGKRAALISADMIESVFDEGDGKLILTTVDGHSFRFHTMEIYMTREIGSDKLPEYFI